jgi:putative PIN family toxin of toxin-antitoxin system
MKKKDARPRVVFDCMLYLQATANDEGPAAVALRLLDDGAFSLFVTRQILAEVQDVLSRPKVRARNPKITDDSLKGLMRRLEEKANLIKNAPRVFEYSRDPKDEPYINLAAAIDADFIVSRDTDLLDLMTGHSNECKEFRQKFRNLKVIRPIEFLEEIARYRNLSLEELISAMTPRA